jgi:hypothetical protein
MKNTKLIVTLIALATISGVSAKFCRDEDGNRVSCTGRVAKGAANILTLGGVSRAERREEERSNRRRQTQPTDEEEKQEDFRGEKNSEMYE